jgi:predicted RNase H-like nuclease
MGDNSTLMFGPTPPSSEGYNSGASLACCPAAQSMRYVGVDGCRAGWIAVATNGRELQYALFSSIREVVDTFPGAERICIDIPIGLPWDEYPIRDCDRLARSVLGRDRRSSVFPVPCRAAVHARSPAEARELNLVQLRRSLSAQALAIRCRIAEVDVLLTTEQSSKSVIREVHPEVCFWALGAQSLVAHRKSTPAGIKERLHVVGSYTIDAPRLLQTVLAEWPRRSVAVDDVLDALVAWITAQAPESAIRRLSGTPGIDQLGLAMEMLYAIPYDLKTLPNPAFEPTPKQRRAQLRRLGALHNSVSGRISTIHGLTQLGHARASQCAQPIP